MFIPGDASGLFGSLSDARRSVRAYLPTLVSDALVRQLVQRARQAPSGANLQPGNFIQVKGQARQQLSEGLIQAWQAQAQEPEDYGYFPQPMPMALRRRQVASAQALYAALGIAREDQPGRDQQFARNFSFFHAPVALVVTLAHDFGPGGYMDLGMALYGLMLAAQAEGLATCAIGAMASYPNLIRRSLDLPEGTRVVCGMALGHADPQAPVNQTRTARGPVDDYFRVIG
ncbi:MAG: oxidoreductase [Rhodoferax sp.]|nr:oxidoreductase [Rhodoferax sp.]